MCGIAGILSLNQQPVGIPELKIMTDSIAHRGPDGEGQWISPGQIAGFGHRRLSIIDLSDAAHQPMQDPTGRYTITFNGEIYNYIELKAELQKKGIQFRTASDTEVLIQLYAYYGNACLRHIDGMFAFAIWDEKEQTLFAARDRFGEKPFFYSQFKNRLYFGSEMKTLFASGCTKEVSQKRLHYYLSYNLYQDPEDAGSTFYNTIFQLPPAHYLVAKPDGSIRLNRYWRLDTQTEKKIDLQNAKEEFDRLLQESIMRRLRSDVPVGSSLSGGLDSSTIVLLINRMKSEGQVQKTFSARFKNFAKDEGDYIHEVLAHAKSAQGFETWPDGNLLDELDKIWYHQEEPFGSASIVAQWSVMRLARENDVTVLLDGQGADEILGGYKQFFQPFLNSLYAKGSADFNFEKKALADNQHFQFQIGRSTQYMLRYPRMFNAASALKSAVLPSRKNKLADRGMYSNSFYENIRSFRSPFEGEYNDDVKKLQQRIIERAGFTPLLRYADRNSMAHSRELRLPFLSHELVEFCMALPDQLKVHHGWTKYVMRETYKDLLPSTICWRKDKVGFEAPQSDWMQSDHAKEMVRDAQVRLQKHDIIQSGKSPDDWKSLMAARLLD